MEEDFFSFFFCLNFLINFIRVLCSPPPNPHPLPQAITTVLSVSMRVFVVLLNACTVFTQPPTLLPCDRCQPVLCTYAYVCILFVKLLCSFDSMDGFSTPALLLAAIWVRTGDPVQELPGQPTELLKIINRGCSRPLVLGVVCNIARENQPRNWYLTMRDGLREI